MRKITDDQGERSLAEHWLARFEANQRTLAATLAKAPSQWRWLRLIPLDVHAFVRRLVAEHGLPPPLPLANVLRQALLLVQLIQQRPRSPKATARWLMHLERLFADVDEQAQSQRIFAQETVQAVAAGLETATRMLRAQAAARPRPAHQRSGTFVMTSATDETKKGRGAAG